MKKKLLFYIPLFIILIISLINIKTTINIDSIYKYHFIKELIFIIIGFIFYYLTKYIKLNIIKKYIKYLYFINIILLILVIFIGKDVNGSKAWFDLGFISFQPSELMKLILILYLNTINHEHSFKYLLKSILITLIPSVLVFIEPDTGAVIIYLLILLSCLLNYLKKSYKITIISIIILLSSLIIYLYLFQNDFLIKILGTSFIYRINRLINFKHNYQIDNALIVIGSAHKLNFKIPNKILYIPESPTDFIFSYSIGNLGYVIGFVIMLCYLLLILYIMNKDSFIKKSLFYIFSFQVIYNISMNLNLVPIMGIPLPFLSYGGTNLIIYFILFGILNMVDSSNYNHNYNLDS